MDTFPFNLTSEEESYSIQAILSSSELYPLYYNFFAKYDYEGNGYCWEGHIIQILEKIDINLLNHIEFDSEAFAFCCYADSLESKNKFLLILCPIFSDFDKLESYVISADRSRIND